MFEAFGRVTKLKDLDAEDQVATLITCLGCEALDIVDGLPYADDRERKDLGKALGYWKEHFVGKTNFIYDRRIFSMRAKLTVNNSYISSPMFGNLDGLETYRTSLRNKSYVTALYAA